MISTKEKNQSSEEERNVTRARVSEISGRVSTGGLSEKVLDLLQSLLQFIMMDVKGYN